MISDVMKAVKRVSTFLGYAINILVTDQIILPSPSEEGSTQADS